MNLVVNFVALYLICACAVVRADEIAGAFKVLTPQEISNLRARLATTVPQFADAATLDRHFSDKQNAARLLSDLPAEEAVMREAVNALPHYGNYKNNLALRLYERGGADAEANELMRKAIRQYRRNFVALPIANLGCNLLRQNSMQEAAQHLNDAVVKANAVTEDGSASFIEKITNARAKSVAYICLSRLEARRGQLLKAVDAAEKAELAARQAFALLPVARNLFPIEETFVYSNMASTFASKLQAYRNAGRLTDAEQSLKEYVDFSRDKKLPPLQLSVIYRNAAALRVSQRNFEQADQLYLKADAVLAELGKPDASLERAAIARERLVTLFGQAKWSEALAERRRLDALAEDTPKLKGILNFHFDNGVLYFGNQQYITAATWFAEAVLDYSQNMGDEQMFTAQAKGMYGAALWRAGGEANRAVAVPLLKASVHAYMHPANVGFLENIGMRKEFRENIFAAYLDAVIPPKNHRGEK
jgi:tetratricopeptide (TPR) repeat protein